MIQLYALRMKKGNRIYEYLHQLNELCDHIAEIGEEVSFIIIIAVLLQRVKDN